MHQRHGRYFRAVHPGGDVFRGADRFGRTAEGAAPHRMLSASATKRLETVTLLAARVAQSVFRSILRAFPAQDARQGDRSAHHGRVGGRQHLGNPAAGTEL